MSISFFILNIIYQGIPKSREFGQNRSEYIFWPWFYAKFYGYISVKILNKSFLFDFDPKFWTTFLANYWDLFWTKFETKSEENIISALKILTRSKSIIWAKSWDKFLNWICLQNFRKSFLLIFYKFFDDILQKVLTWGFILS